MFGGEDDDTDFLSPTGGAKLASLFGLDQAVSGQGNESFQYTAPKQPKKGPGAIGPKSTKPPGAAGSGPAPSVLFATAVQAYRYVNGQYVKQGKFGAAVLGNHTAKEYRILLYISQQQQVAAAKIHPGFVFTVQLNNYAAFYDDQRQSWSIMFESEASAIDFSKQVCIAKCNSSPSLDTVLSQDLLPGDGQAADVGDLLEVAYTGWLFQGQGLGQVFDSNVQKDKLLRLKIGSGKVIKGWEEGMLGIKKGARRLLIIPPALAYGSQGVAGRIPANATLVFEVEVKRMKQKDQGSDRQSIGSRDSPVPITDSLPVEVLPQPPSSAPPKPGEPAVRAKSNSISEQLANPDVAKAKLISRMAKMGHPMLPFLAGSTTPQPDSSDSEIEDPNTQRMSPHPTAPLPIRPTPQISHTAAAAHIHAPVPQQPPVPGLQVQSAALIPAGPLPSQALSPAPAFQPYAGVQYTYPQAPATATQLQPVGHMYPSQLQQPAHYQASGDVTSFLMTEARQHSTEIRISIGKIADKIDNLASKVDNLQKENSAGASLLLPGISSITMESAMILNNIQRITQENERLKQEVLDKSSRIEEQNAKIGELLTRNQRYVEQSNLLMEQRNDSLKTTTENTQARMLHAVQEKHALQMDLGWHQAKVAEELAAATGQVSRLQLEVTDHQKKEMELRSQLATALHEVEKHKTQLSSLQTQLIEVQETSDQTKTRAKSEKESRRQLELRLVALEDEVSDLKGEKENLEKSLAERKRRSQQERQRAEEEQEELRRSFQEEMENLRQLLKKTREQAAEQASTQGRDDQRLSELQEQAAQLQPLREKYEALKSQMLALVEEQNKRSKMEQSPPATDNTKEASSRGRDDQRLSELQEQAAQLQPLREKYEELKRNMAALVEEKNKRRSEEEARVPSVDTTEEVKKIMNSVFQSLRAEFEVEETYSGREVLGTIMSTIKATTLQLLNKQPAGSAPESSSEEEEEEEEGDDQEEVVPNVAETEPKLLDRDSASNLSESPGQTEEAAPCAEEKVPDTLEESPGVVTQVQAEDKDIVTQSVSPKVEEEVVIEHVRVIQEDLDATSALVHMVSSDMHESSVVTSVRENRDESVDGTDKDSEAPAGFQPIIHDLANGNATNKGDGGSKPESNTRSEAEDLEDNKPEVPPPLGSDEDSGSPIPPIDHTTTINNPLEIPTDKDRGLERSQQEKKVSLEESDDEDLFTVTSPKSPKPKHEEEEDEEVCMKGRPPPAPLFGDDEDDDDLDWLG
ncbi:FK506-binding protein 15 [Rhinophrynus dorsalis]